MTQKKANEQNGMNSHISAIDVISDKKKYS